MKKMFLLLLTPLTASAASITDFIDAGNRIVNNILLPIAFSLCVLYFFWGMAKYIKAGSSGDKWNEGRQIMTKGVLALFIVFTIWGIITFIRTELNLPDIQKVDKERVESVDTNFNPI